MEKPEVKPAKSQDKWAEETLPWKAWGSWFSWGSPVGLSLGWALFIIPLGVFIYLLHAAHVIG